eukprot:CAMPEP_0116846764 /NCGR_PEP_ID=MMETSP0418-20121206/14029_1 /TAXON_ID=1158023 /ORGANISM="Astrosyne radiata, Strain 13vi08-1A" /LENGTH=176 /DNA_ID=CAMNT_0004478073 /DNA_START=277 /DNA_END=805 /DNA_ORIENTATION=-
MSSEKHFRMACCGCCMDPVLCCYVACCPCFAFYEAAENIGSDKGFIYLIATLLGFGCCALGDLTNDVAEKAGVEMTFPCAMVYALFDGCFCYSCRSVYESRLIKKEAAPDGLTMDANKQNEQGREPKKPRQSNKKYEKPPLKGSSCVPVFGKCAILMQGLRPNQRNKQKSHFTLFA